MLDKLLKQISKRQERVQDSGNHSFPQMVSDWFIRFGTSKAGESGHAWELAKQDYWLRHEVTPISLNDQPEMFHRWTNLHRRIAEMVALEGRALEGAIIHISIEGTLIAEIIPSMRSAHIRMLYQDGAEIPDLILRRLPVSASPLSRPEEMGFERFNLLTLLWHYAQTNLAAIEQLPAHVGTHRLQLRKLPTVEPAALKLRHLRLLDAFKAGSVSFNELRGLLPQEHWPYLCPDLAALHLTGCLRYLVKS